jgi:alginate O-acetyltransferase complex protein AlgJ
MADFNSILPKLVLPTVFFGYALWVSGTFIVDAAQYQKELPTAAHSVMVGEFTAKLEDLYKDRLPYRTLSTDLIGAARYIVFGEGRKGVVVGQDGWLFSSEEYRVSDNEAERLQEAVDVIAAVQDQLAKQGTDLLVLPLPAKAEIYREYTPYPDLSDRMGSRYAAFRDSLAARNVRTIDARAALLGAKSEVQVFLKGDTHWSPQGATIVAEATAKAAGPLGGATLFTLSETKKLPVEGDLTKFIISPQYASYVRLAPEQVTVMSASAPASEAADALDIFGGEPVEVALVGTSYSANENWSFGPSLMAALGADIVNFAEEGRGPFAPMAEYLDSDLVRQTPPKLVIWEFPVRYLTDPDALAAMTTEKE